MTFATEVLADSPYLWWDTRQISGTTQPDASGNSRTGTVHGSPTVDGDGAHFDNSSTGDDQYIISNATHGNATIGAFAFEAVVIRDLSKETVHGFQVAMGWDNGPGEEDQSGIIFGTLSGSGHPAGLCPEVYYAQSTGGTENLQAGTSIDTALHHVLVEWDGANINVYVDGTLSNTTTAPGGLRFLHTPNFFIAGDDCACADGYGGLVRHAIYYEHSLGATRAAAHATAALAEGSGGGTPPTCSSVTPNHGYTTGGDSIILAGTHLTGATEVDFGGTPATSFTVNSDSQITAVSPPHAEGTVNVTVTTPGGTSA